VGCKVLVVDDDPSIVFLIKNRLTVSKYNVLTAADGREGLEKAVRELPDLLVTDELMPHMTGYQLATALKAKSEPLNRIPIIVITAKQTMRYLFEDLGVHAYMPKPFDAEELMRHVESAIGKPDLSSQASTASTPPVEQKPEKSKEIIADKAKEVAANPSVEVQAAGNTIVLAGTQEFVLNKLKEYFESQGYTVAVETEDDEAVRTVTSMKPKFVFSQFWKDSDTFDGAKIFKALQSNESTRTIPFVVFCAHDLLTRANQVGTQNGNCVLTFQDSTDLLRKVGEYLKK